MGWDPLVKSYMASTPDAVAEKNKNLFSKMIEDHSKVILDMFNWLVQPCLDFIRHECKLFIATSPLHLVHSLLNLYTCILDDFISSSEEEESIPVKKTAIWTQCVFIFSLVWSVGGTMTGPSRQKFSVFFRTLVSGTNQEHPNPKTVKFSKSSLFPERGIVFDYFFQKSGLWASWEDLIDKSAVIANDAKV